jgi:hypothetical protein
MRKAMNRQWEAATFNIAGSEYQKDKDYARQLQAKFDEDKLRKEGLTRFDDFQKLLNSNRMTASGASRALTSPLFGST